MIISRKNKRKRKKILAKQTFIQNIWIGIDEYRAILNHRIGFINTSVYWLQVQEGIGPIAIRGSRAPRQGRRVAFLRRGARSKGCFVSCIRENGRAERGREPVRIERIEISANSHGHFYVGIHPSSIYREGSLA